jgi:hypothetical protein
MVDCTTPYANKKVKMRTNINGGASFVEDESGNTEFYTDDDGFFEIKYITKGWEGTLNTGTNIMTGIPLGEGQNLDIGEVNLNGTFNFVIKLQVNNPYTANDTLYYGDYNGGPGSPDKKLGGPFVSQVLDTVQNYPFIGYPLKYGEDPEKSIPYSINNISSNIKRVSFSQKFCSGQNEYAEAIFIIN